MFTKPRSTFLSLMATLLLVACGSDDDSSNYKSSCCDNEPIVENVNGAKVYIPNAFTPNGDGVNDYFFVKTDHPSNGNPSTDKYFAIVRYIKVLNEDNELLWEEFEGTLHVVNSGWNGIDMNGNSVGNSICKYEVTLEDNTGVLSTFTGLVCVRADGSGSDFECVDNENKCRYPLQSDGDGGVDLNIDPQENCQ